jgi:predicted metal-dependent hydrolase
MFMDGESSILKAIGAFISGKNKNAAMILKGYIEKHHSEIQKNTGREEHIRSEGRCYDLEPIYHELNASYFEGQLEVRVTWGRTRNRKHRHSIKLGSYNAEKKLIRINPVLDNEKVPPYYLGAILFHEMLHAMIGYHHKNGRRRIHTRLFEQLESRYLYYRDARVWEEKNLDWLLRA